MTGLNRRNFLQVVGAGAVAMGTAGAIAAQEKKPIAGFNDTELDKNASRGWKPVSDRKIRVGIAGYGVCQFGAKFSFQYHPNVEVVAVTDLFPDRCAELAKECKCKKTYPSCEEMIQDDSIEAVFIATDAPSHARLAIAALKAGKHVASAVPATIGSLEDAEELFKTVKETGRKYMMFETSCFHKDLYAMMKIYQAGGFGKLVYSEGEYFHYHENPIPSYNGWRDGLPPQWYPTHATAYYIGVSGGSFTEVSCMGKPSHLDFFKAENNRYKNPFGTEVALFRTSEGGMARMTMSWDTRGFGGEMGRVRGEIGSFKAGGKPTARANTVFGMYEGVGKDIPDTSLPPIPPGTANTDHGGSHGPLTNEFITSIIEDRKPLIDIVQALNMTVPGFVAHQSALKDGELMKVPQFKL